MIFLNPFALWGLVILVIPIIIHLFNFRRYKKYFFSNLTVLQQLELKTQAVSRLKKLLILSTRLLGLFFLVISFSNPILSESPVVDIQNRMIYVDNSKSMQTMNGEGYSYFDLVTKALTGITNENVSSILVGTIKIHSVDELTDLVNGSGIIDYSSVLLKGLNEHVDELVIYSDFQKSNKGINELLTDSLIVKNFIKVGDNQVANVFIDSVFLNSDILQTGQNILTVQLSNASKDPITGILIRLERNGLQIASVVTDLNESEKLNFDIGEGKAVSGDYELIIDDQSVLFDNHFYFVIRSQEISKVSLLYGKTPSKYISEVYGNAEFFDFESYSIENTSFQELTNSDLIILDDLNQIPEWLSEQLKQFNGKVLVIPNVKADLKSYSALLGFQIDSIHAEKSSLSVKSLEHSIFNNVLKAKSTSVSVPDFTQLFVAKGKFIELLNNNLNENLAVETFNQKFIFFTFPLTEEYTNLHKHALFVPIMYSLAKPQLVQKFSYSLSDEEIIIDRFDLSINDILTLTKGSESYILPFRFSNNQIVIDVPETLQEPGIYSLKNGQDTLIHLAFNYDKRESDLRSYTLEELQTLASGFKNVNVSAIQDLGDIESDLNQKTQDNSLWKYALLLALLFLLSESILLRYLK